jgi:F0F1-type ATP synthase epsilon subunit
MIDKDLARKEKADAEGRLAKMAKEDQDYEKVKAAVTRADMRLRVAEKG